MSFVSGVDCFRPLCLKPLVWSAWAWETRTLADLGALRVCDGSTRAVALRVPITRPFSHPSLSFRVGFSLGNTLQSFYGVQMEEQVSLRLSIYDLWNRTDDR